MGIAPGGGVEAPNIIATDEAYRPISNEEFAMIQGIVAWVQNMPGPMHSLVLQYMNAWERSGLFEGTWHHEIAKGIKDDIHLHSFSRLLDQMLFELLANRIIFPDE